MLEPTRMQTSCFVIIVSCAMITSLWQLKTVMHKKKKIKIFNMKFYILIGHNYTNI